MDLDRVDQYRRLLIVGGLGAAAYSAPEVTCAQDLRGSALIPPPAETIAYLATSASVGLLYHQFGLAYGLAANIALLLNDEATPGSAGDIALSRGAAGEIFQFLLTMQDDESLRVEVLGKIENADPLAEFEQVQELVVVSFVDSLERYSVPVDSPLIRPAVLSLTHVARIGSVRFGAGAAGFWCNYFPFTVFCGS